MTAFFSAVLSNDSELLKFPIKVQGKEYMISFPASIEAARLMANRFCHDKAKEIGISPDDLERDCIEPFGDYFENRVKKSFKAAAKAMIDAAGAPKNESIPASRRTSESQDETPEAGDSSSSSDSSRSASSGTFGNSGSSVSSSDQGSSSSDPRQISDAVESEEKQGTSGEKPASSKSSTVETAVNG